MHVEENRRLCSRDLTPSHYAAVCLQHHTAPNRSKQRCSGHGHGNRAETVESAHTLFDLGVTVGQSQPRAVIFLPENIVLWCSVAACAVTRRGCVPASPPDSILLSQMILTVYLSDGEQAVTEVPITPETTCRDVVEFCKEPGESGCHLAEVWRGNGKSWAKRQLCGSERRRAATVGCTVTADPPPLSLRVASITDVLTCQHFLLRGHSLVQNNIPDQAGLC